MEKNKEELFDAFAKKVVKDAGLDRPSVNFTDSVLSKIQLAADKKKSFVHQPLISKKYWLLIALGVGAIFAYIIFAKPNVDEGLLRMMKWNQLVEFNLFGKLSNFGVSSTVMYGFLALAFFIWVQVLWLTKRVGKRYQIG